MSSTAVLEIIDDDDDFDWDAAVRQIDLACDETKPSTLRSSVPFRFSHNKSRCGQQTRGKIVTVNEFKPQEAFGTGNSCDFDGKELGYMVNIDEEEAKTWIYPVNVPVRDYQLSITKTALFSNTLVALPTGLGKTLIAAVVMYNYFRWFPEGKIVFTAPSRPLVMQQIEACHNIVGIPQGWTIDMTGQTSPAKRARLWKERRVFFVTPQVLEKDIQSGTCQVKHLVCLVIDEAHRALGNYSYCVAIRELMSAGTMLRILALTATPGSKQLTIQQVIDNLLISTLEHRDESDHDVSSYVHNRKVELVEVPMCEYAVEVSNLLLEAILPFVARLSAVGVLPRRDLQTLSPCELVTSREKFRQSPPEALDEMKYGDVESYFGVLITLYYLRKLLSSHGIRPAYEMLEEKLKQGFFARLMRKNEIVFKVKLLMQKSLNHGAPNPKLVKLLEVLIGHFKINDPQNSRVIIFSNFRGSVRDIMAEITSIGSSVRATEFIGQNSGKFVKGQTQKVQQAVLEKFRAGKYNVIVATSIGEEGLDIMDVDLVICFDSNISPLRMIQRMGRTGRKHDGRVVVLACEGPELKGYMRKQASNKAMGKHMKSGGSNFNFHSSPRMVPHAIRPEVQFVQIFIEQYVPRGRKPRDEPHTALPMFSDTVTGEESALLVKYFQPAPDHQWRVSLITFPNFQTLLSEVHSVQHSSRTGMFVDAMQHLQGSTNTTDLVTYLKDKCGPCQGLLEEKKQNTNDQHNDACSGKMQADFNFLSADATLLREGTGKSNGASKNEKSHRPNSSSLGSTDGPEGLFNASEGDLQSPVHPSFPNEVCPSDTSLSIGSQSPTSPAFLANDSYKEPFDSQLSPRLTSFIQSGIVPESPIIGGETFVRNLDIASYDVHSEVQKSPRSAMSKKLNYGDCGFNVSPKSPTCEESRVHTPGIGSLTKPCDNTNVTDDVRASLADLTNTSCSKDWCLGSQDRSGSIERACKFKRLRRHGNACKRSLWRREESNLAICGENSDVLDPSLPRRKSTKGRVRQVKNARVFIEDEAEVSSEGEGSTDEEVDTDANSQDDSFIDDGVHSTSANTQVAGGSINMMAIYRRSLLSQSPYRRADLSITQYSPQPTGTDSGSRSCLHSPDSPLSEYIHDKRWENKSKLGCERSLDTYQVGGVPMESTDIEPQNYELKDDDQFYQGLDLDVVEAEAAQILKSRQEITQKKGHSSWQENGPAGSPSFDLGI